MENDKKNQMIVKLLVRKRKLLDLREELKSKSSPKAKNEKNEQDKADDGSPISKKQQFTSPFSSRTCSEVKKSDCNPDSPLSEQPSISPPPFSPLTPLLLKQKYENKFQEDCGPHTPYSNQPSISPPPFSPLTPLVLKAKEKEYENKSIDVLDPDTRMDKQRSFSPSVSLLIKDNIHNDPSSSPVQPMTPETEALYNVLIEETIDQLSEDEIEQGEEQASDVDEEQSNEQSSDTDQSFNLEPAIEDEESLDIIENSDLSECSDESFQENSDDSGKDPDYDTGNGKQAIVSESESDVECDVASGDESRKFQKNNGNFKKNKIATTEMSTDQNLGLFNKSNEKTDIAIPIKDKNETKTADKTSQNFISDLIGVTVNEKENLISDICLDEDTVSDFENDKEQCNGKTAQNSDRKETLKPEMSTAQNSGLINKSNEKTDIATPIKNKNETKTADKTTENFVSDLISVTVNEKENLISDICLDEDTVSDFENDKEQCNGKTAQISDRKETLKPASAGSKTSKEINTNFTATASEIKTLNKTPKINSEKETIHESVASSSYDKGTHKRTPVKHLKSKEPDNNNKQNKSGHKHDGDKVSENDIDTEASILENYITRTDTINKESQSLASDLIDGFDYENEKMNKIPDINEDATNTSFVSKNDEAKDSDKTKNSSRQEILETTPTEYITSKPITNDFITTAHEIEIRSSTPTIDIEADRNDEIVESLSNESPSSKESVENNTTDKEHDNLTPAVIEINILGVNDEENNRNENTATSEIAGTSRTRKKRKGRSVKEIQQSKVLRNTGKSYVTAKGIVVPGRTQKYLRTCRLKCAEKITEAEQKQCFDEYWKLGDRDRRASFISKSITILPKKSQKTDSRMKNRDYHCVYKLYIYNEEKTTCKECFCRILGETKGFINIIVEKKKYSPTGLIDPDQRGRHPPSNKRSIEDLSSAINHISSFPSYESHYCRKSTGKKYLSADLSIAQMYREYKKTVLNPISLKLYAKCFHDLNLAFKQPSKDTCNTCDVLNAKIKIANEDRKITLTAELTEHQSQAEKAYSEKRIDKDLVKNDPCIRAFAFDLQQCLPTPYLKTSVSFYKRQLWSFNLTIHDLANNEATCYMWDETTGARGANQIASCLWHFCYNLPTEVKEVIFYSDTCGGQNKNNIVAMMFMHILKNHPSLQTINHKFLLSGHTHMECDSDHAIIEKTKKKTQMKINHLNDWVQLVRTCKIQNHFNVVVMKLQDFLDFSELKSKKGPFSIKKQDDAGEKFLWQPIKWLQYNKSSMGTINFKHDLDRDTPFKSVNFKKRGKVGFSDSFTLSPISQEPLPISAEKKKDIMDLLELIDPIFHEFYLQIKTVNSRPTDPDLDDENPDLVD